MRLQLGQVGLMHVLATGRHRGGREAGKGHGNGKRAGTRARKHVMRHLDFPRSVMGGLYATLFPVLTQTGPVSGKSGG
ncbi:hypothetical protein GCM10025793_00340 [Lysobacter lycopersici]